MPTIKITKIGNAPTITQSDTDSEDPDYKPGMDV